MELESIDIRHVKKNCRTAKLYAMFKDTLVLEINGVIFLLINRSKMQKNIILNMEYQKDGKDIVLQESQNNNHGAILTDILNSLKNLVSERTLGSRHKIIIKIMGSSRKRFTNVKVNKLKAVAMELKENRANVRMMALFTLERDTIPVVIENCLTKPHLRK